jgi:SufS family cysteine desulfurase
VTIQAELATRLRRDFPILDTTLDDGTPLGYLDNAATTQKPIQVLDAETGYYRTVNSNVGRSVHAYSMRATDAFDAAREAVRAFINAPAPQTVIFTKNTTESINIVALAFERRLNAGDEVLITGMEHHSNLLPWRRLCERSGATLRIAPLDETGRCSVESFTASLTGNTRLVAVTHVSNVLGTVNPVREMIAEAHRHGVPVLVDGAQAVAHRAVDVQELDADFYCFSGHKMYGPMGIGVLYGKQEALEELEPSYTGGGIANAVSFADDPIGYLPLPNRLEAGTPNIAGAVGLAAATRYLRDIGMDAVGAHDAALAARLVERLSDVPDVLLFGGSAAREGAIVTFGVEGLHPYDIGNHLSKHGYMTRTGVHCAIPMTDHLRVVGTVRASFGVYNTEAEADGLAEALRTVEPGFWSKEHPADRFL